MQHLHPTIAAALGPHLAAPALAERAQYAADLKAHDWEHEFSDDGSVYRRGRAEYLRLQAVQRAIDRDFAIWNAHAPAGHRVVLSEAA